ncbi:MAG: nucleoside triphosphate pyrophosphohydrolase [Armatimonadota bacterium]
MSENTGRKFEKLVEIMARLRGEGGCPWDREQTHESMKKYLIEETYEAVDAIDDGDMDELRGELGDVLLQILFHSQIAGENSIFDIDDVVDGISAKLIHRHPHVFGDTQVDDADEVLKRWEQIKLKEKGYESRTSVLDGVPRMLPALSKALDISKKAAGTGFEWPNIEAVLDKVEEEIRELKQELHTGNNERISEEIGDLLFTVVNVARWKKIDPEDALRTMIDRFSSRFRQIEDAAAESGKSIADMTIQEMDAVWDRAKQKS